MKTAKQVPIPIFWSIKGEAKIPTLRMLVNPINLDFSFSSLVNETRTLGGFIQEFWGEQLTSVSASGRTAMFVDSQKGLTNELSRSTEAYQYFISLLNIYKNNGKGYFTKFENSATRANPLKISSFGSVIMNYDSKQYEGYFESFVYTAEASLPFNLEYSFSFKVIKTFSQNEIIYG